MRIQAYPAHSSSFKSNVMAAVIPYCFMSTSSALLNKTQINNPFDIPRFSHKPIANPSLKDICKQGNLKEAFQSLGGLLTDGSSIVTWPDEGFAPILELCANKKALKQGQQIHTHIIKHCDLCQSVFLSTKLVFFYGKCRCVLEAEKVFDKMCHRTIFTWNAMLGTYVSNGVPLGALEMYSEMRFSGVPLDSCTFPIVLKACSTLKDLRCGAEIHGLVVKYGYASVLFVVNSLVAMYAKCSELNWARRLFDSINEKEDVVSWNSIISAYSSNGLSIEALGLFREMQKAGLATNSYTLVAALQACEDVTFKKLGMEIHGAILKSSHYHDVYVANALLAMYVRFDRMCVATGIFDKMDEKDSVSWNTMLVGFMQNGLFDEAMRFFHNMHDSGQKLDKISVLSVLATSGRLGYYLNGMEMHVYAIKNGYDSDVLVGNTIIDMYAKCCRVNYMGHTFDKMPNKDFISWSTIIAGYAQNNCYIKALALFQKAQMEGINIDVMMIGSILLACIGLCRVSLVREVHSYLTRRELLDQILQNKLTDAYAECGNIDCAIRMFESINYKDVVSWTSMISSYVHNGLPNEALETFYFMKESNVEPDSVTFVSILSAAASLSALKKGKEIHGFLIRNSFVLEGSIANALVDMYACCGALKDAYIVFNSIKSKGPVLWTNMINANGMHGRGRDAIELFSRMRDEKQVPDHITFLAILYACSHSALIDEGRKLFEMMQDEYQLEPWPEHYACLVDLLGRANRLEEAYRVVKTMQIEPTSEVWCALLGACRVHQNKELGEIAAKKLLEMDPDSPGNYVLISNVFAASGKWKDVEKVRMRMKGSGLKKNPGCSWIEVGSSVHTFMARDKSHPESDKIYEKLARITEHLEREGGYTAQTKLVLHNVDEEEKVKMLHGHSERLAIAYALLHTPERTPIRITKNLRVCCDCHTFCKLVSKFYERELVVRDASRFHHFCYGACSCGDFW
ncbi:pentatricopeptide repeat-containing protein At3g63370, chloroplastic [Tripterygium wilfordii]|uniref:pentatricopeptide repeat-containing protein At3g63370, chloroplastic n=1 Tax=Tripterygium wilfordii TaxID=458696 RepID=UPI0018F7F1B2|nr:pentatricopeptide repeat-containing protein At3g63370, chloroplastic [Tripterygium wilfordii]